MKRRGRPGLPPNDLETARRQSGAPQDTTDATVDADDGLRARTRGDGALDLSVYLPHHLTVIANRWARGSSRIYLARFGVGVNEWRIMSMIAVEPGVSAHRAGQVTAVDKAVVSRTLKVLEGRGLVTVTQDPDDNRKTALRLTPAGFALHDEIVAVALERQRRLLEGFSEAEIAQLTDFALRMVANLPAVNAMEFAKKGGK